MPSPPSPQKTPTQPTQPTHAEHPFRALLPLAISLFSLTHSSLSLSFTPPPSLLPSIRASLVVEHFPQAERIRDRGRKRGRHLGRRRFCRQAQPPHRRKEHRARLVRPLRLASRPWCVVQIDTFRSPPCTRPPLPLATTTTTPVSSFAPRRPHHAPRQRRQFAVFHPRLGASTRDGPPPGT